MDSKKSRLNLLKAMSVTALAVGLLYLAQSRSERSLGRPDFVSGYALLTVSIALMLLSIRKRLLILPLGSIAVWQQIHHYLGLFAVGSFLLHAGVSVQGGLETMLSLLFWGISLSGLLGWYINYATPKKLRATGRAVLREDIPSLRDELAKKAYSLALHAAGKSESACLAEHYMQHLRPFFQKRRSLAYCLVPNGRMRRNLLQDLEQVVRYLGPDGKASQSVLSQLIREKDDLDFQWAMLNRLRGWVIVHVSLIWSFYFLVAIHVYSVYRFHGS
jgi:hypothetical protein